MIENHIETDKAENRIMNDYINKEWILETYNKQNGACAHCGNMLNKNYFVGDPLNLSVNRICNEIGHVKNNCELTHHRCNITIK
jgi:hypothetical protein